MLSVTLRWPCKARPSKGDGSGRSSFEARKSSRLRMTDNMMIGLRGSIFVTVSLHPLANLFDLGPRQQRRCPDLQAAVILARQGFDLDREPHRFCQRWPDRDHAVMRQQAS